MVRTPSIQFPQSLRLSHDQFLDVVRANPDLRMELTADGQLIIMSPTGSEGGNRNAELTTELAIWNRNTRLGKVFDSSTGFRLPNGATRSPDSAWISNERWRQISEAQRQTFAPICPDFIIELASESDNPDDLREKMLEYRSNGCALGWLILPKQQQVEIYQPNADVQVERFSVMLSGEPVLPGFRLRPESLFDSID